MTSNSGPAIAILRRMEQPYWLPVQGTSMQPLLLDRDQVRIEPLTVTDSVHKRIGGLVLIARSESDPPIVHRICGVGKSGYFECGDSEKLIRPLQPSEILGVVTARNRNGRIRSIGRSLPWRARFLLERILQR